MKWLPSWMILFSLGAYEEWGPQCRWLTTRDKYRKDTIFLHNFFGLGGLSGFCRCRRPHILLQGSLTTQAAAYPAKLSEEVIAGIRVILPGGDQECTVASSQLFSSPDVSFANPVASINYVHDPVFDTCADSGESASDTDMHSANYRRRPGSKPYIVSLSESLPWRVTRKCKPRRAGHINLQEQRAWRLVLKSAKRGCRVFGLQDSRVNLGAGAKGRSPSQSLNRLLVRSGAVIL